MGEYWAPANERVIAMIETLRELDDNLEKFSSREFFSRIVALGVEAASLVEPRVIEVPPLGPVVAVPVVRPDGWGGHVENPATAKPMYTTSADEIDSDSLDAALERIITAFREIRDYRP